MILKTLRSNYKFSKRLMFLMSIKCCYWVRTVYRLLNKLRNQMNLYFLMNSSSQYVYLSSFAAFVTLIPAQIFAAAVCFF